MNKKASFLKPAEVQFKLANLWQSKGKIDRAIAGYEEAIRLQPDYVPAHLELANLLLREGKAANAIKVYERAISLNPNENCFSRNLKGILSQKQCGQSIGYEKQVENSQQKRRSKSGRILLYTDQPGINGAEQCNHAIMLGLAADGYQLTCAQSKASHHLIHERTRKGIRHEWIEDDDIYNSPRTARSLTDFSEPQRLYAATKPDLIIFADGCPLSNLAAKEAAREIGIPYMIIVHCVTYEWARFFAPQLHRLPAIYQKAQEVIAVSKDNLNLLQNLFGLPQGQGMVVHNGRSEIFFSPPDSTLQRKIRLKHSIPLDAVVSITVARMEMVKGYQYQLKAIQKLRECQTWQRLYFLWIGTGSLEPQLRAFIKQIDAADHVKFLGETSDVPDILSAGDLYVLTSLFEGMPLSILEAMAKGLPVVGTSVSGVPEALGDTGKLIPDPKVNPGGTVEELIETVRDWALNPELRYSIGQACKRRAEQMFREEKMIERYVRIVQEILTSHKKIVRPTT